MNRLVGKVAVITGAGSGIGRASAKLFVAEGAKVVVAEIDATLGEATAREAGAGARFVHTDVTDEESVKQMVQHAREAFGHVDVLRRDRTSGTRAFVDDHQWSRTLSPLVAFCREPRIDKTKDAFAARLQVPENPPTILQKIKRRIGGRV